MNNFLSEKLSLIFKKPEKQEFGQEFDSLGNLDQEAIKNLARNGIVLGQVYNVIFLPKGKFAPDPWNNLVLEQIPQRCGSDQIGPNLKKPIKGKFTLTFKEVDKDNHSAYILTAKDFGRTIETGDRDTAKLEKIQ